MFRAHWVVGTLWLQFRLEDQWVTLRLPMWPVAFCFLIAQFALLLFAVDWAIGWAVDLVQ